MTLRTQILALVSGLAVTAAALRSQTPAIDTSAAIRAADSSALHWLKLLDSGQLATCWEQAATSLKQLAAQPIWEQSVHHDRARFGPLGVRQRITALYSTTVPNAPVGKYVFLEYRAQAASGAYVVDWVGEVLDGERGWRVASYVIRPE
jgi:hypothetical protein